MSVSSDVEVQTINAIPSYKERIRYATKTSMTRRIPTSNVSKTSIACESRGSSR